MELTDETNKKYLNNYFLTLQKDIEFPATTIRKTIKPISGGYEISLSSDQFARAVFISIQGLDSFINNNYFDILPGETVTTQINTTLTADEFEKELKIMSIRDAY